MEFALSDEQRALQDAVRSYLRDRFGPLPAPVENLVYSLRVKLAAQAAGVAAIQEVGDALEIRLHDAEAVPPVRASRFD